MLILVLTEYNFYNYKKFSNYSVMGYELFVCCMVERHLNHRGLNANHYRLEMGDWSGGV